MSTLWRININLRYKLSKKNGLLRMYVVQFKEGNIICVVSCDRRHRSLGSSHPSFLLSPSRASEGRGSLTLQSILITPELGGGSEDPYIYIILVVDMCLFTGLRKSLSEP